MIDEQAKNETLVIRKAQIDAIDAALKEVRAARKVLSHKLIHLDDVLRDAGFVDLRESAGLERG